MKKIEHVPINQLPNNFPNGGAVRDIMVNLGKKNSFEVVYACYQFYI